ncbi:deoxyribodipyrimidine photo-lyase [Rhodospirillales bacterium TMPK1]|uniref:Deoxyribodipyrimidine photo-lyase n=1 Tax=Roseiterribacter gracilis TaxID=2812848 RepID=A0A8S8XD27_9PROT|nr:deoxyribodipyrimidine photo-lyase [Rhodospirillales bacterium TMPK1]
MHDEASEWAPGGASRWWLHHSLASLSADLAKKNIPLVLRRGRADRIVPALVRDVEAGAVFWNRCYEPHAIARDKALKASLQADGIEVSSFNASLLREPWTIETKSGGPFKVFTPFWRALLSQGDPPPPRAAIAAQRATIDAPPSDALALLPTKPDWAGGLRDDWEVGEKAAQDRLDEFCEHLLQGYSTTRNLPATDGTSRLSPHLHFGEISPRRIFHRARAAGVDAETFLKELGWREFSYHLLFHFPTLPVTPLYPRFEKFPWRTSQSDLRAWQRGQTGYPLVDAGMRQLWQTGWMHNRVRMVVASFLIKHLLLDWRDGERWFWDTLVDADLASNAASWQWVAGSGADAAPYVRVFNPTLQGEKFDADGAYVRRFVPELAKLPAKWIHDPSAAPDDVLQAAGVVLGKTYPTPIVAHKQARSRALAAFEATKETA